MRTTYGECISELKPNEVMVFGANLSGFHGAGSAGFASFGVPGNRWREFDYANKPKGWKGKWNVKGQGEGLQEGTEGKSYALPTVWKAGQKRSLSREEIVGNIRRMYACAKAHPQWRFLVAGSTSGRLLCGYSHEELCAMYRVAGPIPDNVVFSVSYTDMIEKENRDEVG